jgi:hypothetical protein
MSFRNHDALRPGPFGRMGTASVDQDAENPGPESVDPLAPAEGAVGTNERILERVFGIFRFPSMRSAYRPRRFR